MLNNICIESLPNNFSEQLHNESLEVETFDGVLEIEIAPVTGDVADDINYSVSFSVGCYKDLRTVMSALTLFNGVSYPYVEGLKVSIEIKNLHTGVKIDCSGYIGDKHVAKSLSLAILRIYTISVSNYIFKLIHRYNTDVSSMYLDYDLIKEEFIGASYISKPKLRISMC